MRKTLITTALLAVTVLTACSSKSEDAAPATSSETSTSLVSSETSPSDSPSESTDSSTDSASPSSEQVDSDTETSTLSSEDEAALSSSYAALQQQLQNQLSEVSPVQGTPAAQADVDQMRSILQNIYGQTTLKAMVRTMADNSCAALLQDDPTSEINSMPDYPIPLQIQVTGMNDALVSGDDASVTAVMTAQGQSTTVPLRFKRENGTWKICTELNNVQ